MFALLCSAHIFYKLQKLLSASSQIKCAPTARLIKILRLNDSFIQANMDADFPATQTSFSHKMKTTRHSHQWNVDIKILMSLSEIQQLNSIKAELDPDFSKNINGALFPIIKGVGPFNCFFKDILHKAKRSSER